MADIIGDTTRQLKALAAENESVLVAYSGGKDSLVVMDLCVKSFRNVVGFFMYLVPGLECVERQIDFARERWGVEILYYPHWLLTKCITQEVYCPKHFSLDDLPTLTVVDVYHWAQAETGIRLLATGAKESDYSYRRKIMKELAKHGVVNPLAKWRKEDVLAYLGMQKIPIPETSGRATTGIDLSTPSLLWLHDTHPADFQRLLHLFPYADAAVARREFYGIR